MICAIVLKFGKKPVEDNLYKSNVVSDHKMKKEKHKKNKNKKDKSKQPNPDFDSANLRTPLVVETKKSKKKS